MGLGKILARTGVDMNVDLGMGMDVSEVNAPEYGCGEVERPLRSPLCR